jgi:hypothetical protein
VKSPKPSYAKIDAALLRFNEETVLYCRGIAEAAAHNYAMDYSRMLRNRAKGLEGEQIRIPGDPFEPNCKLIEATLEEMYRKYFAT